MAQDLDTVATRGPRLGTEGAARLLGESDLEVIDALQLNPRATWAELGAALGLDPVTVARRWHRLTEKGDAWATAALGQRQLHTMSVAILELDCEGGAAVEVAAALAPMRHLITIQHVAGSYDLWIIAVTDSLPSLAQHLLHELPQLDGVRKVRTHMATRVFDASRHWRLRVLPPATVGRLQPTKPARTSTRPMDDLDRALFTTLSADGRATYDTLADLHGTSGRTIKRRLDRLVAVGDIDFRCDLARRLAGWHASAILWLEVPDDALEVTGNALLQRPETRTCAALASPHNLMLTVGLHGVSDLQALVTRLRRDFPHVRIADRQIVLRQTKLYGRVLDVDGRWVSATPVDPWSLGLRGGGSPDPARAADPGSRSRPGSPATPGRTPARTAAAGRPASPTAGRAGSDGPSSG